MSRSKLRSHKTIRRKVHIRVNSVRKWMKGRESSNLTEPTKEEINCFVTGFNMGWQGKKNEGNEYIRVRDIGRLDE